MSRPHVLAPLATGAVLLGAAAISGCSPVTLSAPNSVAPLLLGPVHKIGGGQLEGTAGELVTAQNITASASSSTTQSGNVQTTTTTSSRSESAPTQTDFDLTVATEGRLDRGFAMDEIDCDTYFFLLPGGMITTLDCGIEAGGVALVAPAKVAPKAKPAEAAPAATAVAGAPVAAAPVAATAPAASKPKRDVLSTRGGRKLRGKVLVDDDKEVVILLPNDETVRIPRADVEKVVYSN